jgi:hypothetical protein
MKVFSPKLVVINLAGLLIDKGFAEDSLIKVTYDAPRFEDVVGVDGEVTRVQQYDQRALVTLSLMQSSDANDLMSALLIRDQNTPNGGGVGAFLLKDLQGTTLVRSPTAWVKGFPETEFAKKVTSRNWEIRLANAVPFVGGNVGV